MDRERTDSDDNSPLLDANSNERTSGSNSAVDGMVSSSETIVFDGKLMKTSTQAGELAATWGGRCSLPDSGRLRRVHSWSGGPPDDVTSEIRILRERLVRTQTRLRPGALLQLSRHQRLTLASLALVDFMSFCSMSIMAPFFPREASIKGLSDTMCGIVFSFYAVIMFLTSPLFGKFLPAIGAKFMFIAGMFIAGACNVLFGVEEPVKCGFHASFSVSNTSVMPLLLLKTMDNSYPMYSYRQCIINLYMILHRRTLALIENTTTFTILCFVVRGMEALGASAYSTASYVFVVNAFPDSIGSVLGILETFVGLGMSVGPAIGGLLYSIGGFGLPFYSLGIVMVLTVPINFFLLTDCGEYVSGSKSASILQLFKIPSIVITGLVIVVVSNTWAFLDPTLEPHLRQFNLSTKQIGLIFLLFSSLYGIFSPIWGWVADRVHNHWCMMVWGLFLSSIGLLLLGPCPFIPGLTKDLWLDLVALSILGMSVALTLLPTFQGVLTSSIYEGGCPEALATYSAVAGVWSCCYSLGEVLGPALGGALSQRYGFPLCATLCAAACFTMAVVTLTFFSLRESSKWIHTDDYVSESVPDTDTTWNSNYFCRPHSAPESKLAENSPLITSCSCASKIGHYTYTGSQKLYCLNHSKNKKSGFASVSDVIAYVLKFQFLTITYVKIRRKLKKIGEDNTVGNNDELYQNYLRNEGDKMAETSEISQGQTEDSHNVYINNNRISRNVPGFEKEGDYCAYLGNAIFESRVVVDNVNRENLIVKRHNTGLVSKLQVANDKKRSTDEMIEHNLQKVHFYEQNSGCASVEDIFDGCECRDGVTYVRGTVTVSSAGACEV